MNKKGVFDASFEESLNFLLEDEVTKSQGETIEKEGTYKTLIIVLLFLYFPLQLISLLNNYMIHNNDGSTLPLPEINFLPPYLVPLVFFSWLVLIFPTFVKYDYKAISVDKGIFFLEMYFILAMTVIELWILTWLTGTEYVFFVFVVLIMFFLFSGVLINSKRKSICLKMFKNEDAKDALNKLVIKSTRFFTSFLGIILIIYYIFKWFLPSKIKINTATNTSIVLFIVFLFISFIIVLCTVYFAFPQLISLFYKTKYSEELRDLEGQSQLDWYGKKYYNKYIKGTSKEALDEKIRKRKQK